MVAEQDRLTESRGETDASATRRRRLEKMALVLTAVGTIAAVLGLGRDLTDSTVTYDDIKRAACVVLSCSPAEPIPSPVNSAPPPSVSPEPTTKPSQPTVKATTPPAGEAAGKPTARIVVPDGGDTPLCTPISGTVSGLEGDRAAWLLVKGPATGELYYLLGEIALRSPDATDWNFRAQQIGDPGAKGKTFQLRVIGTEGDATAEYHRASAELKSYVHLPAKYELLDEAAVTIVDDIPCR
ncbi:hypothetical protein [Couchioplanes caeruleus]|uniref:hypothetical protein n=1 Tax=Couchioplanes caeruleus TaxID=56438 RepID=UPI0011608693|nr:hypothetical protein [Couchioplanes caeruleus]